MTTGSALIASRRTTLRGRKAWAWVTATACIASLLVIEGSSGVVKAAPVPQTNMELDGNGFANSPGGHDWSCYFGTLTPSGTVGADPNCAANAPANESSGLLNDPVNSASDDEFGQVKDADQISGCANTNDCWEWRGAAANPDKNDLEHGGAISFPNGTGVVTYFMA